MHVILVSLVLLGGAAPRYDRDVRPILADRCFTCHGPDAKKRQAELRLDQRESALAAHPDGIAIVPGKPDESELWKRITQHDAGERMPPANSGKRPLSDAEKELLRRWIAEGAVYEPHWSFVPPVAPPAPAVKDAHWVRDPLDRFVLARLEQEGLAPSPEAERETLLRRVFLDLTGLPPTPEELAEFLADVRPDAYERCVDRLLQDEPYRSRYAEHLAVPWLDAARYGDTNGIHTDAGRQIWPWRDWLLGALRDEHALRPLRDRADRGRPPAGRDAGSEGRQRLQPQPHHDRRGRRDRRRVPGRVRGRPRQHHQLGLPRPDDGLRALPRPQVRPVHAGGLLLALRLLRLARGAGPVQPAARHQARLRAVHGGALARAAARAGRRAHRARTAQAAARPARGGRAGSAGGLRGQAGLRRRPRLGRARAQLGVQCAGRDAHDPARRLGARVGQEPRHRRARAALHDPGHGPAPRGLRGPDRPELRSCERRPRTQTATRC